MRRRDFVTILAALINPAIPAVADALSRSLPAAASALGLQLHVLHVSTERELDAAFATLVQRRAGALVIGTDSFYATRVEQLVALTLHNAVPAIYPTREFPVAGGLITYGSNLSDAFRLQGAYTGRILKDEKPAACWSEGPMGPAAHCSSSTICRQSSSGAPEC
jgi:putative ABC transport system substrate-binding protein